jgi:hypothetical protein
MPDPSSPRFSESWPVSRRLSLTYASSYFIAALMVGASLAGLIFPDAVYPSAERYQSFAINDIVNLVIGLPILLSALWLARRKRLVGLLFWPGALLFVLYNYLIYSFTGPVHWLYLVYLALVVLSFYTLAGLLASIDAHAVQQQLAGRVPGKLAGGVLAALGILFLIRAVGLLSGAFVSGVLMPDTELALNTVDLLISPVWILTGVLLWQRQQLGYVFGLGALFSASMLFIGLLVLLFLQPILTNSAGIPWTDIGVVFLMGLVCFVPFILFLRGALRPAP